MSLKFPRDSSSSTFHQAYCSKACMIASQNQSHRLLFSSDPPLPAEFPIPPSPLEVREARRAAQIKLVEFLKKEDRASPLLLARFVARQVTAEMQKMVETTPVIKKNNVAEDDFTDSDGIDHGYGMGDHMERLRYLEIAPDKKEVALLSNVLQLALPGLEGFVLEERYAILSGKMTYNAFGVSYNGGRDDRVRCRVTLPFN
jgi:import receptor subunit TOM20